MKKLLGFCAVFTLLLGCGKFDNDNNQGGSQQCSYDSCAVKAPASEIQSVQAYLSTNNITATQHCSGLFYSIEAQGSGTTPTACSYVTVKYVGKLTNGTIFDQTPSGATASFYLSQLIRGWTNGLPYIKPGGKVHLYIPPSLGYGTQATNAVPANSILIFDVELLTVF